MSTDTVEFVETEGYWHLSVENNVLGGNYTASVSPDDFYGHLLNLGDLILTRFLNKKRKAILGIIRQEEHELMIQQQWHLMISLIMHLHTPKMDR